MIKTPIDRLLDSIWFPRTLLAFTFAFWVWTLFDFEIAGFAVALGLFTYGAYEGGAAERRATASKRARRYSRDLELTFLAQMGAEDYLRRTLIADLKQVKVRRQAQAWLDERLGERSHG